MQDEGLHYLQAFFMSAYFVVSIKILVFVYPRV